MRTVPVYSKNSEVQHLVDTRKYTKVSCSRSLCGLRGGKSYWVPDAVYYIGMKWPVCKKCAAIRDQTRN